MELDSVLKLINAVSDSSLTSFTLDDGNTKLSFAADRAEVIKNNEFSIVRNTKEEQNSSYEHHENDNIAVDSTNVVSSPLVGIFYSAASPDEKDFVSVGDTVKKGQVLGIVEAMKLMNEITAEEMGTIREVCLEDATPVEFGTPLFYIEPHVNHDAIGPESA